MTNMASWMFVSVVFGWGMTPKAQHDQHERMPGCTPTSSDERLIVWGDTTGEQVTYVVWVVLTWFDLVNMPKFRSMC